MKRIAPRDPTTHPVTIESQNGSAGEVLTVPRKWMRRMSRR